MGLQWFYKIMVSYLWEQTKVDSENEPKSPATISLPIVYSIAKSAKTMKYSEHHQLKTCQFVGFLSMN